MKPVHARFLKSQKKCYITPSLCTCCVYLHVLIFLYTTMYTTSLHVHLFMFIVHTYSINLHVQGYFNGLVCEFVNLLFPTVFIVSLPIFEKRIKKETNC